MRIINNTDAYVDYSRLSPTVGSGRIAPHQKEDLNVPPGPYSFSLVPGDGHFQVNEVKGSATVEIAVTVKD
jgi:hypothetical protein